ncbi:MAG: hypothetical protein NUV97_03870 [archaeon]|nr:hypothetical protein [archaeon]MCR4323844.1 hypothetical protein [Nanoarchaeota archaeon]
MKKRIYLGIFGTIIIGLTLGFVIGINSFNANAPWHSLQQITTDEAGTNSVDTNPLNGIVDLADAVVGRGCRVVFGPGGPQLGPFLISGANFVWDMPMPPYCLDNECYILVDGGTGTITSYVEYTQLSSYANFWYSSARDVAFAPGTSSSWSGTNGDLIQSTILNQGYPFTIYDDQVAMANPSNPNFWAMVGPSITANQVTITVCG